jgi:hypothetical protein
MMTTLLLIGSLTTSLITAGASVAPAPSSSSTAVVAALGVAQIRMNVLADGKPLTPGRYEVALTDGELQPAVGQSAHGEIWVEFRQAGKVKGREVASVIPEEGIGAVAKSAPPKAGTTRVELLLGGDYLRIWINDGDSHYLINLRVAH